MKTWFDVYPKWAREMKNYLEDTIIDHLREGDIDDEPSDRAKDAAVAVVCETYGHYVEDDQCMRPEHRYCFMCNRLMPNIEPGHYVEPKMMTGIWPKEAGKDTVDLADVIPPFHNHTHADQPLFQPPGVCPGCDFDVEHEVGWIRDGRSPAPYPDA